MNKNDFKNPLIQSGAVLLVVFLLISIVANAESHGILGSVSALISGLFSGILFIIALFFAIVVSIAIIIGLFIAAVSIHSVEKAGKIFRQLQGTLVSFYQKFSGSTSVGSSVTVKSKTAQPQSSSSAASTQVAEVSPPPNKIADLEARLQKLADSLDGINAQLAANNEKITTLDQKISEAEAAAEHLDALTALEKNQEEIKAQLEENVGKAESAAGQVEELRKTFESERKKVAAELDKLHEKTSVPEVVSGILSYIDSPEDREEITQKAEEAVARGLTYAQIDDFFKKSFSSKIYKTLSAHPRLTKDFIRSIKKKF